MNSFPTFTDRRLKPGDTEGCCLLLGNQSHVMSPQTSCLKASLALGPAWKACGENWQVRPGWREDEDLSHWKVFPEAWHELHAPLLHCALWPCCHPLGAAKWALTYLLRLVCTSATSKLGAASQKQPFLHFLPLLSNLSMSRHEPKRTREGLSLIFLFILCISHEQAS